MSFLFKIIYFRHTLGIRWWKPKPKTEPDNFGSPNPKPWRKIKPKPEPAGRKISDPKPAHCHPYPPLQVPLLANSCGRLTLGE